MFCFDITPHYVSTLSRSNVRITCIDYIQFESRANCSTVGHW